MKKFALAAVAAAALSAGVAQAYTVGTFSNGFVVPNVIHNGAANTTAVGIVNRTSITVPVFWTFFDQNSNHGVDGCIGMTANQYKGFNWAAASGVGMEGKRGYLVFAVGQSGGGTEATVCSLSNQQLAANGATTAQIAGNAFYVDLAGKSVAFTPVIDGPLVLQLPTTNLTTMGPYSLLRVAGAASVAGSAPVAPAVGVTVGTAEPGVIASAAGANANHIFGRANTTSMSLRYYIDGTVNSGNDTRITVWSTGNHSGSHTVNIYDNAQNRQSVNFDLKEGELSWFDPETVSGRPAAFLDGFIDWNPSAAPVALVPAASPEAALNVIGGDVVAYSTIVSPAFGAVQTLLGAHR